MEPDHGMELECQSTRENEAVQWPQCSKRHTRAWGWPR